MTFIRQLSLRRQRRLRGASANEAGRESDVLAGRHEAVLVAPEQEARGDQAEGDGSVKVVRPHDHADHDALDDQPAEENATLKGGPQAVAGNLGGENG